jgi:hypothetical protein
MCIFGRKAYPQREPNPLFSTSFYFRGPEVRDARLNAFAHYLHYGWQQGRDSNTLFDHDWYVQQSQDVAEQGCNPLLYYWLHGAFEGRDPDPLFNSAW